jgi:hypothetical protein
MSVKNWVPACMALWILAVVGVTTQTCHAQTTVAAPAPEDRVRSAVQSYLQSAPLHNFKPTSYMFAFVELAEDRTRQAIVYLTGRGWCGSGGCTMLVLTQEGSSYKVISRIPAVRLPIRVLESKSHGWRDLSVFIQGGGILRGYEERVRFNGESYSKEASEAAEEVRPPQTKGKIILSLKNKEVPLYP